MQNIIIMAIETHYSAFVIEEIVTTIVCMFSLDKSYVFQITPGGIADAKD